MVPLLRQCPGPITLRKDGMQALTTMCSGLQSMLQCNQRIPQPEMRPRVNYGHSGCDSPTYLSSFNLLRLRAKFPQNSSQLGKIRMFPLSRMRTRPTVLRSLPTS